MRLAVYIFMLFGISLMFYLLGYHPYAWEMMQNSPIGQNPITAQTIINLIAQIFLNPYLLLMIGGSLVAGFLLGGGNFSVVYIVPLFMLLAILNLLVFPTSFLFDPALDPLFKVIVGMMFNLFLILTIVEFVKGGMV